MKSRKELLGRLVRYSNPVELVSLREQLSVYPWDSETKLVVLSRADVCDILLRFTDGDLSSTDIENWAEALEMREDIAFGEDEDDPRVQVAIYALASPALEGLLDLNKAEEMIRSLE